MTLVAPPVVDPSADSPVDSFAGARSDAPMDPSVDEAVARLAVEFHDRLRPQLIVRVVSDARRDLGGSPVGALPELVERLARIRLAEAIH